MFPHWLKVTCKVVSLPFHLIIRGWFSLGLAHCQVVACLRSFDSAFRHGGLHEAHRKHVHLSRTRARLHVEAGSGMLGLPPGTLWEKEEAGEGVCEREGTSRCSGWKKDEGLNKIVLLWSPWRLGWAVAHLQANPKTITGLNGFANDKMEWQISIMKEGVLHSRISDEGIAITSSCNVSHVIQNSNPSNEASQQDKAQLLEKHENTKTKPEVMMNEHLMATVTWHQTEQVHQKNIWKYVLYLYNIFNLWITAEMPTVNFPLPLLLLFCEIIKVTHYTHSHFWLLSMNCFWFRPRAKELSLFFPFYDGFCHISSTDLIFDAVLRLYSCLQPTWSCTERWRKVLRAGSGVGRCEEEHLIIRISFRNTFKGNWSSWNERKSPQAIGKALCHSLPLLVGYSIGSELYMNTQNSC